MQFQIDNASSRAVYQQIIDQVKRDIALGRLVEGEKLPTVRQLATKIAINPNTIAKAYRQLEQQGIITTRPGSGAFISHFNDHLNSTVKKKIIFQELDRVIVDGFHMGIEKETLAKWFDQRLDKFKFSSEKG